MNLQELQEFVRDFQRVSIAEMKLYLGIDRQTLNPLLEGLMQQGTVKRSYTSKECSTCQKCDTEEIEFYEWIAASV
ncbi:MAG: FeoC-like transcriptional regulator [Cyanobacteria bacterium J06629_2]